MFKKLSFFALAFLLLFVITGVAQATNIPMGVDPQNEVTVWTETVYNGSGSSITSGYVVQWDFDTSNPSGTWFDDMTNYVKTNATADGPWIAGVATHGNNIANGNTGQIIIKGPAIVYDNGQTVTADTFVSATNTGLVKDEACDAVDEKLLGVAIKNTHPDLGAPYSIIYVDPTPYENGS